MEFQFPRWRCSRKCCSGLITLMVLSLVGCNDYVEREKSCTVAWQAEAGTTSTLSSGGAIHRPGWFVLFRQGNQRCAVRLTSVKTTSDPESGCAEYEAYSWVDGEKARLEASSGSLSHFSDKGFHGFSLPQGRSRIGCGALTIRWIFPTRLAPAYEFQPSIPIQYSLTAWETIEEVDPLDSRLVWMAYDVDGRLLREFRPDELPR